MDHPDRRPPRPSSPWRVLALAAAVTGVAGLAAGCKSGDEKKPDEEPAVALKIPESGELPGGTVGDATSDTTGTSKNAAHEVGAPHIRTSAAGDETGAAKDADPTAGPARVTARESKKLPGRAAVAGPPVRSPAATLRPGPRGSAVANGAGDGDGAAVPTRTPETPTPASDTPDDGAGDVPEVAAVDGSPSAAPPRLAGRGPAPGAPARQPDAPAAPALNADRFLPLVAVRELVAERRIMAIGPLAGIEAAPGYNSVYYGVPGKESFGAAIQVWQDPDRRGSIERFRRMRQQYPNAEDVKLLEPTTAFYSTFGAIQTLTMADANKRLVVSVSCGADTCSQQVLLQLAQHAQKQL